MARRKLYRYYVRGYLRERDATDKPKQRVFYVNASSECYALRNAALKLLDRGIHDVYNIHIVGEPIALEDLRKHKPPQHKHNTFRRIYDGTKLIAYEHAETGVRLSPEDYKNLDE